MTSSGVLGILGLTAPSASLATLIASSALVVFSTLAAGVDAFVGSGLPTDEVVVEVALDAGFLVALIFALLGFLLRVGVFRGGVVGGTLSATLLALACVGRIILARKPSSTLASFLGTGWSLATCFGGGPILGRCLPATDDDLATLFPGRDDLLVDRGFVIGCSGEVPFLVLEPDAAVWVVRLGGSLTGRVGDLGLGLTKPPGETLEGVVDDFFWAAGFLSTGGVLDRFEGTWVGLAAGFGCDEGVEGFSLAGAGVDALALSAPFTALGTPTPVLWARAAPGRLVSLPWFGGALPPAPAFS